MRVLLGIIVGVVLTVGSAYLYDSHRAMTAAQPNVERPLVNWDVVASKWQHLTARARAEWNRLAS
jgi:hypothetical protein